MATRPIPPCIRPKKQRTFGSQVPTAASGKNRNSLNIRRADRPYPCGFCGGSLCANSGHSLSTLQRAFHPRYGRCVLYRVTQSTPFHRVFDFHGGSPLLELGTVDEMQRPVPRYSLYRMSTCTTAPPAFRKLTSSARNDSSVCCASMSRSPAAMARRVSLSHSTKWRRDDESPLGRAIQRSGSRSCPGCTTNTSGYDFRKRTSLRLKPCRRRAAAASDTKELDAGQTACAWRVDRPPQSS